MSEPNKPTHPTILNEVDLACIVDELVEHMESAQPLDLEAYVAKYPDHADQLRQLIPALEQLVELGSPAEDDDVEHEFGGPVGRHLTTRALGDFRIIREIGRGGMGVVYEAEQLSLGRSVAVKVLPFAAILDSQQLQRFKNEAHAAAQLKHANIVGILFVGAERGVHFYAMDLVDGRDLSRVIAAMRKPQSLEAAGSEGKTGRDGDQSDQCLGSKPATQSDTVPVAALSTVWSNRDAKYFQFVARLGIQAAEALDFAHRMGIVHRDIKPSNLLVDVNEHLWITDFGLAVTPTEGNLTVSGDLPGTLRYMSPEQAAGDRTILDHRTDIYSLGATLYELATLQPAFPGHDRQLLLRQIAEVEPVAPRRLEREVPTDLETIILKAMAKEPSSRYATAQQFADDLRRYTEDKPIVGRRPSLVSRAAKWTRRNIGLVSAVAATLILCLSASTLLLLAALAQVREKSQALQQEQAAKDEALAEAEANLRIARQAVDDMYSQAIDKLEEGPRPPKQEQKEFLEKALSFYENFADQSSDNPDLRFDVGKAHQRAGRIYLTLGHRDSAQKKLELSIQAYEALCQEYPENAQYSAQLATAVHRLGHAFRWSTRDHLVEPQFQRSQEITSELLKLDRENPDLRHESAKVHVCLAERVKHYNRVRADALLREAVRLNRGLVDQFPDESKYRITLCGALNELANLTTAWDERESILRETIEIAQRVAAEDPTTLQGRNALGVAQINLALILRRTDRAQEGLEMFRQSVSTFESLANDHPKTGFVHTVFFQARAYLINALLNSGHLDEAEAEARKVVALARNHLHDQTDNIPFSLVGFAARLIWFHRILIDLDRQDESREVLHEAIEIVRGVHNRTTWDTPTDQRGLAGVCRDLAVSLVELRELDDALDYAQRAADISARLGDRGNLAEALVVRGRAFETLGQSEKSASEFERAMELWGELWGDSPHTLVLSAITHAQRGQLEPARVAYREFVKHPKSTVPAIGPLRDRKTLAILRDLAESLLSETEDDKETTQEGN